MKSAEARLGKRSRGVLHLFAIGLFKKVVLADSLSLFVRLALIRSPSSVFEAWVATLSYTFQLYFDFPATPTWDWAPRACLTLSCRRTFYHLQVPQHSGILATLAYYSIPRLMSYLYIPLGVHGTGCAHPSATCALTFLLAGSGWSGWTFVVWGDLPRHCHSRAPAFFP
jgi:D-alanyl-lipoteichoic acid acyltransferase DltB (MBOAT superfamily)